MCSRRSGIAANHKKGSAAPLSPAGRLANLLGQAGLPSAIKLRSVLPAFDPFLAQQGPATAPAQSMHRCRQRLPPIVGSRLVVNAIVVERTALRLAIPDRNWTFGRQH